MTETIQNDFKRTPLENWKFEEGRNHRVGSDVEYPPPMHPETEAVEPRDSGTPRAALHPVDAPPPTSYSYTREDWLQAVDDFGGRIASIQDSDYGDWMRRANTYWWRLVEALHGSDLETHKILGEIHRIIQYNPSFMVHETRRRVIDMTLAIREHLGGRDDLDPQTFGVDVAGHSDEEGAPEYSARLQKPKPAHVEPIVEGGVHGFFGKG